MILKSAEQSGILGVISSMGALFLLILGIIWIIYALHHATRRKGFVKKKAEDFDLDVTNILKVLSLLGIVVGALAVIAGVGSLILDEAPSVAYREAVGVNQKHLLTSILLIVLGLLTFVKPINDLPIAGILGFLAAAFICILISFLIPDEIVILIGEYINPKILLAILFIIVFALVALVVKFWTSAIMFLSKVISWPPLAIAVAVFCFLQGGLLLVNGTSILP